jgi:ABC-type Mn2+/Zn2+ transport system permease subunit
MLDFLIEPLKYAFMLRALVGAIMVGVVCAVVGTYIVLRGMAFFGDALAHSILPGVAIGYLVGGGAREPLFWWALVAAVISSLGIGAISQGTKIRQDTAIGSETIRSICPISYLGMCSVYKSLIFGWWDYLGERSY